MRALYLPQADAFLRYLDLPGADPPRVYVHGLGYSSASLVHIATHTALAGSRSVLVDLLGAGLSDKPDGFGYSVDDHTDTLIALAEHLELRGCEVIGHSLGGSLGISLAARRPDVVASLVAAEANLDPGMGPVTGRVLAWGEEDFVRSGFQDELDRMRQAAMASPNSPFAVLLGTQASFSPLGMYRTARSLTGERTPTFREQLLGLDLPRAFIVGSRTLEAGSKPASGEAGEGLEKAGVRRYVVSNAGHPMMFENPDGFAGAVAQALQDARAESQP